MADELKSTRYHDINEAGSSGKRFCGLALAALPSNDSGSFGAKQLECGVYQVHAPVYTAAQERVREPSCKGIGLHTSLLVLPHCRVLRNVYTARAAGPESNKNWSGLTMDVWGDIFAAVVSFLRPVSVMPYSAVFVLGVGILLTLISSFVTVKMVDVSKLRANMAELRAWQTKFNQARKTMDPTLLQEVVSEQSHIMQLQPVDARRQNEAMLCLLHTVPDHLCHS